MKDSRERGMEVAGECRDGRAGNGKEGKGMENLAPYSHF